jgi:hypothetical protein
VDITITIGSTSDPDARSLTATVKRRRVPALGATAKEIVDIREHDICGRIARRISQVMERRPANVQDGTSIQAIGAAFDESVVALHLQEHPD